MRSVPVTITHETWEEASNARRVNRGLVCRFRDKRGCHRVPIGAGESDDIDVYREGPHTFILTRSHGLGYVGLEVFEGSEPAGEVFLQADHEVSEALGADGLDKSGWWIARVLVDHALAGEG